MYSLSGPAFYRAAFRLAAYQGVMACVVAEAVTEGQGTSGSRNGTPGLTGGRGGRDVIPATKAAIQAHPELAGVFSFG